MPLPIGTLMLTVSLLNSAANLDASSVEGLTIVRSHAPRFALTRRQPSALLEICSGSAPSGARPKPPVALSRSTIFQLSASITDMSPLALLGTNANVRDEIAAPGGFCGLSTGGGGWHTPIGRPETT